MNSYEKIRGEVLEELQSLLEERDRHVAITDQMNLNSELGLSSLDIAELVALLGRRFGCDPFRKEVAITSVRTVFDLCAAYTGVTGERRQKENSRLVMAINRAQARREDG